MKKESQTIGTLNDVQIKELCDQSKLITDHFEPKQIHQACYELRAGTVYYDLTEGRKRITIPTGGDILIKPRHMVVIITRESLKLPTDTLGRILTKGQFFSLGLTPVNTYADPGFSGNLGIVLFNSSINYVRIPVDTSIAKIEFSRLAVAVENSYSGQHGYETSIWPIPEHFIMTEDEIKKDSRIGDPMQELVMQQGELFGVVVKRVFKYERWLLVLAASFLSVNLVVIWSVQKTELKLTAATIAIGVITNLITAGITLFATNLRRR